METMTLSDFRQFTKNVKASTRLIVRMPDGEDAPITDAYVERRVNGSTVYIEVLPNEKDEG